MENQAGNSSFSVIWSYRDPPSASGVSRRAGAGSSKGLHRVRAACLFDPEHSTPILNCIAAGSAQSSDSVGPTALLVVGNSASGSPAIPCPPLEMGQERVPSPIGHTLPSPGPGRSESGAAASPRDPLGWSPYGCPLSPPETKLVNEMEVWGTSTHWALRVALISDYLPRMRYCF